MTSKQFINNTILLNTDGGGEEVAAWIATTKRIWPRLRFHAKDQLRCAFCGLLCSGDSSFPVSGTPNL